MFASGSGGSRTHSIPRPTLRVGARNQGGLPVAYRAVVVLHQCPEQDSNLQSLGFKPSRSADWRI